MSVTSTDVLAMHRAFQRRKKNPNPMQWDEFWFRQAQYGRFLESLARAQVQRIRINLSRTTGWADG